MAYAREYYWANREKITAYTRAWYASRPPEKVAERKARRQAYRKANAEKLRAYVAATKERRRAYKRAMLYGIQPQVFEAIHAAQDGKCAICGTPRDLAVDHDHATGAIRGLLCGKCNTGLGMFGDSAALLEAAIAYLTGKLTLVA